MKNDKIRKLTIAAMLSAVSLLLVYTIRIPFPLATFLVYDPADIPMLLITFVVGPLYALVATIAVSIFQALFLSADGWVGGLMHILSTGALVLTSGLIYKKWHSLKGAIVALSLGTIVMTIFMVFANLTITTSAYGYPLEAVIALLPVIIGFNLLKGSVNSLLTMVIYKKTSKQLKKYM